MSKTKTPPKTTTKPGAKTAKPPKATQAQREAAVAQVQAADAAANAHADGSGKTAKAAKTPKAPKEPKAKKTSGLDAAAQVLKDKGEPMTCKDIVETMLAKGLWTTNGKTPAATIYSAMLREIDGRPGESRFVKTGRGLFGLTKKA